MQEVWRLLEAWCGNKVRGYFNGQPISKSIAAVVKAPSTAEELRAYLRQEPGPTGDNAEGNGDERPGREPGGNQANHLSLPPLRDVKNHFLRYMAPEPAPRSSGPVRGKMVPRPFGLRPRR